LHAYVFDRLVSSSNVVISDASRYVVNPFVIQPLLSSECIALTCLHIHLYYLRAPVQVVIESDRRAVQYGSVVLKQGEPIKQDIALDRTHNYLYAMTDDKVNLI